MAQDKVYDPNVVAAIATEEEVLASCLVHDIKGAWWAQAKKLSGLENIREMFYEPEHRKLAEIFDLLLERHLSFTRSNVIDWLPSDFEEIISTSPMKWISNLELKARIKDFQHLQEAVNVLVDKMAIRDMLRGAEKAIANVTPTTTPIEFASALKDTSLGLRERSTLHSIGELITEMEENFASGTEFRIPFPVAKLNETLRGLEPSRLYTIAARPKVGKTMFASNMALTALSAGAHVLYVSLEMSFREMLGRLVSTQAFVEYYKVRNYMDKGMKGNAIRNEEDLKDVQDAIEALRDSRLYIMESKDVHSVDSVIAAATTKRMEMDKNEPFLVIVDYVQLLTRDKWNERAELDDITRKLKLCAQDLNIPIVLVAQINRDGDGGMPTIANLKGSGSLEQDSDAVLLMNRQNLQDDEKPEHILDIKVGASRYSAQNVDIQALYDPERQTITDLENISVDTERDNTSKKTPRKRVRNDDDD